MSLNSFFSSKIITKFAVCIAFAAVSLLPLKLLSQSQVVINEILFSPQLTYENSLYDVSYPGVVSEWIELYNPSLCDSVDLSCWILGSDETEFITGSYNYGAFVFPSGTMIPPNGFLVVGGVAASPADFNIDTSPNFCGYSRWYLRNSKGWIALYDNLGAVKDAVYWANTGASALSSAPEFNNALNTNALTIPCSCSGSTINSTPAKNIVGIEFAGIPVGIYGEGWQRTSDGGNTWATVFSNNTTPNAPNGTPILALSANIAVTNPSACGQSGSATITATGGHAPYSYAWSNGASTQTISSLTAGSYTCTVTDAFGCATTASASVSGTGPAFTLSMSNTNLSCFGGNNGSATATPTSGTGTFTYSWNTNPVQTSQTAQNLVAGTYSVSVTNAGCVVNQSVTITEPSQLQVSTTTSASQCGASDGSATASPSGGTQPYTYFWSPTGGTNSTENNLTAGNYTVSVTDANSCVLSSNLTITDNSSLSVSLNSVSICEGESANLTAIPSTDGGTYLWSSNNQTTQSILVSPATSTSYTVTYSLNGCTASATATVDVSPFPIASVTVSDTTIHPGESVTLYAFGGETYLWSTGETASQITLYPQENTMYCLTAINALTCTDSICIPISLGCGSTLFIPNSFTPSQDNLNEQFQALGFCLEKFHLMIYNRWGELIFETKDLNETWDGTYKDKPCQSDVYTYLVTAKGYDKKIHHTNGSLTLIR